MLRARYSWGGGAVGLAPKRLGSEIKDRVYSPKLQTSAVLCNEVCCLVSQSQYDREAR